MCGRSPALRARRGTSPGVLRAEPDGFFGLDAEKMGPWAQVAAALAVIAPVALSGVFLVIFAPGLWWIFTTYFWVAFPAFGLLGRGLTGMAAARPVRAQPEERERELLAALRDRGELTPAGAAAETSLTVAEADERLGALTRDGHLEVRVRGDGIFYRLWDAGARNAPEIEGGARGE